MHNEKSYLTLTAQTSPKTQGVIRVCRNTMLGFGIKLAKVSIEKYMFIDKTLRHGRCNFDHSRSIHVLIDSIEKPVIMRIIWLEESQSQSTCIIMLMHTAKRHDAGKI